MLGGIRGLAEVRPGVGMGIGGVSLPVSGLSGVYLSGSKRSKAPIFIVRLLTAALFQTKRA